MSAPRVLLGVAGGIAAYKACELLRRFTESGHSVRVLPTASALEFIGAATFEALSGQPRAHRGLRRRPGGAARQAGPGGRARRRRARDRRPAGARRARPRRRPAHRGPAHRAMPGAVRARHAHGDVGAPGYAGQRRAAARPRRCRARPRVRAASPARTPGPGGCRTPPRSPSWPGCSWSGPPRCPATSTGRRVVVSAGGTREALDPVRFLGNRSSGRQGYALARVAAQRGAHGHARRGAHGRPRRSRGRRGACGSGRRCSCATPCTPRPRARTPS